LLRSGAFGAGNALVTAGKGLLLLAATKLKSLARRVFSAEVVPIV